MKTSSKLLIVFFFIIPISVIAYNVLLKKQFLRGEFTEDIYPKQLDDAYFIKELPPFKNIVIDGALVIKKDATSEENAVDKSISIVKKETKITSWRPNILIKQLRNASISSYKILKEFGNVINTRVNNDTLYITFVKANGRFTSTPYDLLTIDAHNLKSLKGSHGNYSINGNFITTNHFKATGSNAYININTMFVDKLDITAEGRTRIMVYDNNKINELNYTLINNSTLDINQNCAKRFKKISVDSLSEIAIHGPAEKMERFLPMANGKHSLTLINKIKRSY